ncbi:hypothetical protein EM595_p0391 (plasmid) [Duffyella gerundensis]|uniref:Uncharacterized protein n=1 Tax=Duffyella gerundensis TaxID=1619313 RepID=A0A0U5L9T1_9GAMM|nr:hypothetical protein EM595_p0391 [Duffyella gerundensis]
MLFITYSELANAIWLSTLMLAADETLAFRRFFYSRSNDENYS